MKNSFMHRLRRPAANQSGYVLLIVTMMGLVLAIIFGHILPQLHMGQQTRALLNLNEARAWHAAMSGIEAVRLGVKTADGEADYLSDLLDNVANSIDTNCKNHFSYKDPEGINDICTSGCMNITPGGTTTDFGQIDVAVFAYDPKGNIAIYYSKDGATPFTDITGDITGTGAAHIHSADGVYYLDFDKEMTGDSDYKTTADIKYTRDGTEWRFAVGHNGSWRESSGATQLWNLSESIASAIRIDGALYLPDATGSFQAGETLAGDSGGSATVATSLDANDILEISGESQKFKIGETVTGSTTGNSGTVTACQEIIIVVRARGITVAPDLSLLSPAPLPQILEAGFYLEPGSTLGISRFYFAQAHNLE